MSETQETALGKINVNPLAIVSSLFLLAAPFLTWTTLVAVVKIQGVVVTGFAVQSSLLNIAARNAGFSVTPLLGSISLYSTLLLVSGGLASLRKAKIGLPVAALGFALFGITSFSMFGVEEAGATTTYVSPGIGLFLALFGIALGSLSGSVEKRPIGSLMKSLRTGKGVSELGVFLALVSLALDGLNHSALGQLPDLLGSSPLEEILHIGFFVGLGLTAAVLVRVGFEPRLLVRLIVIGTFAFLLADGAYHLYGGDVLDFVGHNSTEVIVHTVTYYGVVLIVISNVFMKRK